MRTLLMAMTLLLTLITPVRAVQPDEILPDPALEARARALSTGLRCLVCRNENIDESNADLARDLRLLLRERLVAGDSDTEVIAFLVERFGEYVLLTPTSGGANLILWLAGPGMLALGFAGALIYLRSRKGTGADQGPTPLTPDEKARLDNILGG